MEVFFNYQNIIFIALFALVCFSLFFNLKQKKRLYLFFKDSGKDVEKLLKEQIQKTQSFDQDLKQALERIYKLENISQKSFQKIGMIRFNPFNEVGGDQSFCIALLDADNNGFVITSHFLREANRVYSKEIKNGKSNYSLSDEEKKAIEKAMSGI